MGTFVKVKREFIKQYHSLIKTNKCDLSNVQWPKRAEGSTGIPPVFEMSEIIKSENTGEVGEIDVTEEEMSAQKSNTKIAVPLPLLLAIIGGVAVGVGVMLVLRKKK